LISTCSTANIRLPFGSSQFLFANTCEMRIEMWEGARVVMRLNPEKI
jgi:hypothetical protein